MSRFAESYFTEAQRLAQGGRDFVVVTWLVSEGHAPQDAGAKALVTSAGLHWGTVGGGKVEARAIARAREIIVGSRAIAPEVVRWDLQRDIGMSCGGSVQVLFEYFPAEAWSVVIFGAGHVAQALVRTLALFDCKVSCLDNRREWLDRLPREQVGLTVVETDDAARFADDLPPSSYCVLVTRGHDCDVPILKRLLRREGLPYIGVIGSKVKARAIRAELLREGFTEAERTRFHCPMGIPLASHQPAEIALSIAAQLVAVKNGLA